MAKTTKKEKVNVTVLHGETSDSKMNGTNKVTVNKTEQEIEIEINTKLFHRKITILKNDYEKEKSLSILIEKNKKV